MSKEWLIANLPIIGKRITANAILIGEERRVVPQIHKRPYAVGINECALVNEGRSGLPSGSRTSSVVATHVVASVLEQIRLPEGVDLVVYIDDFAILGRTERDVVQAHHILRDAFGRHPAGEFTFDECVPVRLTTGVEYLGYEICRDSSRRVDVRISDDKMEKFSGKLCRHLEDLKREKNLPKFQAWFAGYLHAHAAAGEPFLEGIESQLSLMVEFNDDGGDPSVPDGIGWALEHTQRVLETRSGATFTGDMLSGSGDA